MAYDYRAFGLNITADAPIPGLATAAGEPAPDVEIELAGDARAWGDCAADVLRIDHPPDDKGCSLRLWADRDNEVFRFLFGDGTEFVVEGAGAKIRARWPTGVDVEGACVYLLGPIMGFALRLRGLTCLHGCAVSDGSRALAVLAGSGRGKSTTAAAFARRGVPVLTDDLLVIRDDHTSLWAQPATPRIRLWPHAAEGLFGSADALPRITPDDPSWDKRFIDLAREPFRFCEREVPLAALYVGIQDDAAERPSVEEMNDREALFSLLTNSYSRRLQNRRMLADDFAALTNMLQRLPVLRFRLREGFEHLDELCEMLLYDCRNRCAPAG
jgi:hypothetical protein